MKPLRDFGPDDLSGGIRVIDLGASGEAHGYWHPIARLVHSVGFDPNAEECRRLNALPTEFASARFLPYAIAGETGPATLHKTRSIYCWSLLPPNHPWLRRFSFGHLFDVEGTETINAYALSEVPELAGLEIDAIKLDTQGLELPILRGAGSLLDRFLFIETETGFTQNYLGESTFYEVGEWLSARGFGLFSLSAGNRIPRANALRGAGGGEQILWCEARWFRDFQRLPDDAARSLTRAQALRALCLFANQDAPSAGMEAARFFADLGLLTGAEIDAMASPGWWEIRAPKRLSLKSRAVAALLARMPARFVENVLDLAGGELKRRNPPAW